MGANSKNLTDRVGSRVEELSAARDAGGTGREDEDGELEVRHNVPGAFVEGRVRVHKLVLGFGLRLDGWSRR